jgi:hypothetical protein
LGNSPKFGASILAIPHLKKAEALLKKEEQKVPRSQLGAGEISHCCTIYSDYRTVGKLLLSQSSCSIEKSMYLTPILNYHMMYIFPLFPFLCPLGLPKQHTHHARFRNEEKLMKDVNAALADSQQASLPSGELTVCYGKIHHAIHGKIHYFYSHFPLLC